LYRIQFGKNDQAQQLASSQKSTGRMAIEQTADMIE
jgi:hypothetical protein